jgi:glutathione S-transferase
VQLFQIPFSHNCVKVRRALELKGLPYEAVNVNPVARREVKRASGQWIFPALVDNGRAVSDSTAILLYLEDRYPERPLLPADANERTECLVLEDWADSAFMELTRRLAYWAVTSTPGLLENLFFPAAPPAARRALAAPTKWALKRRFRMNAAQNRRDEGEARRLARLAVDRIGGRSFLVGESMTIADVTLAALAAPMQYALPVVREDAAVRELLAWSRTVLGEDFTAVPPRSREHV